MTNIDNSPHSFSIKTFPEGNDSPTRQWNSCYIKQLMHEKKIDEFFLTDTSAPEKRKSWMALVGSFVGVALPIVHIAKKQNPNFKLKSLKTLDGFKKALDIEYNLKEMLQTGFGGLFGGLAGGLMDRKEQHKWEKLEEASFQFMNILFPTYCIDKAIKFCDKKKLPALAKIGATAVGLFAGSGCAVAISNKVDRYTFDKYNKEPDRVLRKKDLLIHIDDMLGALVLAKIPFMDKLHIDRILPAIFTWNGFQIGDS